MGVFTGGMASGYEGRLTTSINQQSVDSNQTYLHIVLDIFKSNPNIRHGGSGSWWIALDGVQVYSGNFTYDFPLGATSVKVLLAADRWIAHNGDGTKSVNWTAGISSFNIGSASISGTDTFPTIARASTVLPTSPTTGEVQSHTDAGAVVRLAVSSASSAFRHTLRYEMSGGGAGTIATGVVSTYDWTIPLALMNDFPDANTGYGTLYVDTYSGSTLIGTKGAQFGVRVPAAGKPTIGGATVVDTVAANNVGKLVQRISKPSVTITGISTYYGSPIMSAKITMAGQTLNLSAGDLDGTFAEAITASGVGASGVPIVLEVTDSRGRIGTLSPKVDVLPYTAPQIKNVVASRRTTSAGTTESDSGIYVRIDFQTIISSLMNTTERNSATYTLQYRAVGGSTWTADKSGPVTLGTVNAFVVSSATLIVDASREYRLVVTDKFGFAEALPVMAASVVLHLDGSAGIGVRKIRERGALDVLGDVYFSGIAYVGAAFNRLLSVADLATQAQAEAATTHTTVMTPLRVAQAIDKRVTVGAPTAGTGFTLDAGANRIMRFEGLTTVVFSATHSTGVPGGGATVGNLPVGLRPAAAVTLLGVASQGGSAMSVVLVLEPTGAIRCWTVGSPNKNLSFSVTFP